MHCRSMSCGQIVSSALTQVEPGIMGTLYFKNYIVFSCNALFKALMMLLRWPPPAYMLAMIYRQPSHP